MRLAALAGGGRGDLRKSRGAACLHHHTPLPRTPSATEAGAWRAAADRIARHPEQMLERADDIVVAFLALLERLPPEARTAFLLREMFDADYDDLSRTIGKSEAASRQMVHRAKKQLRDERPRYAGSPDMRFRLLSSFAEAMMRGDFAALKSMLADDVELIGDGGGGVPSFGKPLLGGQRVAQFLLAASRRYGNALRIDLAVINGQWGLLRYIDGALESAQSYETDAERIVRIHVQAQS